MISRKWSWTEQDADGQRGGAATLRRGGMPDAGPPMRSVAASGHFRTQPAENILRLPILLFPIPKLTTVHRGDLLIWRASPYRWRRNRSTCIDFR